MEVLVAIAVAAVLLGLLLAAVQKVRATAARAACQNNLKQVALGIQNSASATKALPAGLATTDPAELYPRLGWLGRLLPHVEQGPLWQESVAAYATRRDAPYRPPHVGIRTPVAVYACPADERQTKAWGTHRKLTVAVSGYLGVLGTDVAAKDGVLYRGSATRLADVTDGTSNTLLAGERPPSPDFWRGWWYASGSPTGSGDTILGVREQTGGSRTFAESCPFGPYAFRPGSLDDPCDAFHFWSRHAGGAHFAFCDGSVRFLPYSADATLPALATRAGAEAIVIP